MKHKCPRIIAVSLTVLTTLNITAHGERMDPLAIVVTVSALYLLLCILVSLFIDADATTFLYSKLGPPVSRQLAGRCVCRCLHVGGANCADTETVWLQARCSG